MIFHQPNNQITDNLTIGLGLLWKGAKEGAKEVGLRIDHDKKKRSCEKEKKVTQIPSFYAKETKRIHE